MEIKLFKRNATEEDVEFVRQTHHAAYHDVVVRQFGKFDEKMQDAFFANSWKPEKYQILMNGNFKIGYCSIEWFDDCVFVNELVLLPDYQGKGIGTKFLLNLLEEARAKNVPVRLQVLKMNQAQNLYSTLGFRDVGSTETHIQMECNFVEKK